MSICGILYSAMLCWLTRQSAFKADLTNNTMSTAGHVNLALVSLPLQLSGNWYCSTRTFHFQSSGKQGRKSITMLHRKSDYFINKSDLLCLNWIFGFSVQYSVLVWLLNKKWFCRSFIWTFMQLCWLLAECTWLITWFKELFYLKNYFNLIII